MKTPPFFQDRQGDNRQTAIRTTINNRWADELYTDEILVKVGEENAKPAVSLMDVEY